MMTEGERDVRQIFVKEFTDVKANQILVYANDISEFLSCKN